jgi:hypothetical protein
LERIIRKATRDKFNYNNMNIEDVFSIEALLYSHPKEWIKVLSEGPPHHKKNFLPLDQP